MAPWEPCNMKPKTKVTTVPLPYPLSGQLVVTSMVEEGQAQAKIELQDNDGSHITTLMTATSSWR